MLSTPILGESYREAKPGARPAQRADDQATPAAAMLRAILGALREGLRAQRRYEHLKSEGVHHDPAIRRAFGIPLQASPSEGRRRCHRDCRADSGA